MKTVIRWIHDAWIILGVTLLLVLLGNETLKAWVPEHGGLGLVKQGAVAPQRRDAEAYQQADWVDGYYREHHQARSMRWEPYVYWRRKPYSGELINVDQAGHRQSLFNQGDLHGRRVFVFGGSTVWGTGVRDEHTLPSEIAALLEQRGIAATVTNYGESGYVSSQGLIALLRELQQGNQPDLAIFYDGVNDVFSALQSGQVGIPQNEAERRSDFRVTNGLDNYLAGFPATLEGVNRVAAQGSAGYDLPEAGPLATRIVDSYLQNVKAIRALGRAFGFKTVFVWQPSVFSKSNPAPGEQAIINASLAYHRELQLAADTEMLSRQRDAGAVINLSGVFGQMEDPVYIDFCHLSEQGNQFVARFLIDQLPLSKE